MLGFVLMFRVVNTVAMLQSAGRDPILTRSNPLLVRISSLRKEGIKGIAAGSRSYEAAGQFLCRNTILVRLVQIKKTGFPIGVGNDREKKRDCRAAFHSARKDRTRVASFDRLRMNGRRVAADT
jgi:hypothetical protein